MDDDNGSTPSSLSIPQKKRREMGRERERERKQPQLQGENNL
jgi:hypothetical protein